MMLDFDGRVVLVTGAGRGLGYAYAESLVRRGATVVVQDIGAANDGTGEDPELADAAAALLRQEGGRASADAGPISCRDDCAALIGRIIEKHGRLDCLIHNAGWVGYQPVQDLNPDFLGRMIRIGIEAPLWLVRSAWPFMRDQQFGRILLNTSDRAIYGQYSLPA